MICNAARQSNFELLRIISMFMIVLHHLVFHGVMQCSEGSAYSSLWLSGTSQNRFFADLFFPGGEVGIALFFMISGYFLIKSNSIRLMKVVSQTIFYSWISVIVFFIVYFFCVRYFGLENPYGYMEPKIIMQKIVFGVFAPLRSEQYWFASAYIALILVKPLYNSFLVKLNKKGYVCVLIALWLLGLVFSRNYVLFLGYTQAIFYYALGGFLKIYSTNNLGQNNVLIALLTLMAWIAYAVIRYGKITVGLSGVIGTMSSLFCSCILVILISVGIFEFFSNLDIGYNKLVNTIASTTFGVYLLHEGFFIRPIIWDEIIGVYSCLFQQQLFPLLAFFSAIAVFAFCSLFEYYRALLFVPIEKKSIDL